jgi:CheY-like chemotaxis protein
VLVVHPEEISRLGLVAAIGGSRRCEVEAMSMGEARLAGWDRVDILVIDVVDPHLDGDQLSGLAVIEAARAQRGSPRPRVVVIGHLVNDDAVRRRVFEAGADRYVHRGEVPSAVALTDVVLAPSQRGPVVPPPTDPERMIRLGVTPRTRVNAAVAAAYAEVLVPEAGWVGPRGRDRDARRARFNEAARLRPADAVGLDRAQHLPSLRQIQRFVTWATRVSALSTDTHAKSVPTEETP